MKLPPLSKVGLVVLALGLGTFLAVAIWFKTVRDTLADIPMPMRAEVASEDFTVDYDGPIYTMEVQFDRSVSETSARCLLGAIKSDLRPELDCTGIAPLLKFSWELYRDGQFAGRGSSADMGSISKTGGAQRVMIVGFPAQTKHGYEAMLKFENNARDLAIPSPRVRIELDSFVREDIFIWGAVLDAIGFVVCFIGLALVAVPLLRLKFTRLKTLPEPR